MSHPTGDYHRPNQLWRCAAECESALGPTPWGTCRGNPRCTPRLSVRGRRGVFVASCLFATLGLTLLALAGPWRNTILKPGPLSSAHTQALEWVADADRCTSCHEAASKDPLAWIKIASGNVAALSEDQATRCLKCHEGSLGSEYARNPHNVSPELLAHATQRVASAAGLENLVQAKLAASGEKACAACHKEHHGVHANLAELSDQQCQACHVRAFESFAEGHPEFRHTIPSRRSDIAFDHVSHVQKHFPEKQQAFACNQCHVDDAGKNVKRLAGFEQSCAKCHSKPLEATTQEGLVAFSFPTLDVQTLKSAGQDVGAWPSSAMGDFDGALPPLVRTLLLADDEAAAALEQLDPQFDFAQVRPDELQQVAALAWSYKRLLNDLANGSAESVRSRLEKVTGGKLPDRQLKLVLRQLPPGLFREARRRWLPGLHDELAKSGRAQPPRLTAVTTISPQVRSELLVENPLAKEPSSGTETSNTPQVVEPTEAPPVAASPGETASETPRKQETPVAAASDPGEWASSGTWYLDDATLSVRYRPRGHADELMRLLVDVSAATTSRHVPQQGLLATTLQEAAFKTCASCHSIDTAGEHYSVNWHVQYRDPTRRDFVEFSHRPHLLQSGLADCTHCHQLDQSLGNADPMAHAHDFQPITKSNCVTCHSNTQSGGRCTLCHSYHVDAFRGR
jgi:hypothetical protein